MKTSDLAPVAAILFFFNFILCLGGGIAWANGGLSEWLLDGAKTIGVLVGMPIGLLAGGMITMDLFRRKSKTTSTAVVPRGRLPRELTWRLINNR